MSYPTSDIKENILLAPYTYFKIGGPARYFIEATDGEGVASVVAFAKSRDLPFFILGAGSNILVSDNGFPGVVIRMRNNNFAIADERVTVGAGLPMAQLVAKAVAGGYGGIEWAIGIPGTVGGSVRGNAGCFGGEIKNVTERAQIFDTVKGETRWLSTAECRFGYRTSVFKERPEWVLLALKLKLSRGSKEKSQALIREYAAKRTEAQAIGEKSAGCIFKNIAWERWGVNEKKLRQRLPDLPLSGTVSGIPAGYLIDRAGLTGYRVGGAEVSKRHGNFVINAGGATAEDVVMLIGIIKDRVRRQFGVLLEEEIQYVGFE